MTRTLSTAALLVGLSICLVKRSDGQIYSFTIDTVAGNYTSGDGGLATAAYLLYPGRMVVDAKGNVYFADSSDHRVRKVVGGIITTIAGTGFAGFSGDGGKATDAQLNFPSSVGVDSAGNIYIYDSANFRIRKVDTQGAITTFAGTGAFGYAGDGGAATQAKLRLNVAGSLAVDSAGNIYISDVYNSVVRKVSAGDGTIRTVAGMPQQAGNSGDGQAATSAKIFDPCGLAFDAAGNLYIADGYNYEIRMVSAKDGTIRTVAGDGKPGSTGDGGPATSATLGIARDVAVDTQGNIYILENDTGRVRKVTAGPNPTISTFAGSTLGFSGDGGPATSAQLSGPDGIAVDASGTVYIADSLNGRIRVVRGGTISEFAGADRAGGDGGKATVASLYAPERLAWDTQGNYYIADTANNRIRKVTSGGIITTIAGNGSSTASGDGGPATSAGVVQPRAVAADGSGNLFIATQNQIRRVDSNGNISTVVNTTNTAGFNGDGTAATAGLLNLPLGLALDSAGALYIADTANHRIRKVSGGIITTVAGSGPICLGKTCNNGSFAGDGGPATSANLSFPSDVTFDHTGNLVISDSGNNRIRLVDANGKISTLAGSGTAPGYAGDLGPATSALLSTPISATTDQAGNLYISDQVNNVIRMVDGYGIISTIAGTNKAGLSGDGGPATSAALNAPEGIYADPSGNVWFVDVFNHRVRKLTPSGPLVPSPAAIVNAASFVSGGLVPGGMATLFGSNLTAAKGINLAGSIPLATELLNSSVKFNNNLAAPIFAVDNVNGQQQINFQVPWELAGQTSAILQVVNNGALSPTVRVPVLAAQPGVFAYNVGGTTFGVVLHANFQLADSGHPATGGEVVLIYCTNLGAVSPTPKDGVAGTGNEITVSTPAATIGGAPATVSFHGLAPGFVGLYQVNIEVPKGLTATNQDLVLTISGASSPPVKLPVK